jgi:double-strand break repair protein MRE11
MPDEKTMADITLSTVGMDKIMKEYFTAQSSIIFPQNSFRDSVSQFIDKDDKHAMVLFVATILEAQQKYLMEIGDETEITDGMGQGQARLEEMYASGQLKKTRKGKTKPKPFGWDSEEDGPWTEQPGALIRSDNEEDVDDVSIASGPAKKPAARGRGKAAATIRPTVTATKKAALVARSGRGSKKAIAEEEEEEVEEDADGDAIMISGDDDESAEDLFVKQKKAPAKKPVASRAHAKAQTKAPAKAAAKAPAKEKSPVKKTPVSRTRAPAASKQTTLSFSQTPTQRSQPTRTTASRSRKLAEPVSDGFIFIQ